MVSVNSRREAEFKNLMSGTPRNMKRVENTRNENNCRNYRNCRLLDRYPGIQLSVVGEQLLATLAVRKRPCRPRIGYRLCTDALLVTEKVPAA